MLTGLPLLSPDLPQLSSVVRVRGPQPFLDSCWEDPPGILRSKLRGSKEPGNNPP